MFQRQKKNQSVEEPQRAPQAKPSRTDGNLHGWQPPATTTPRKTTRPTQQSTDPNRKVIGRIELNGQRTTSYPQGTQGAPNPQRVPRTTSYPSPLMAGRRGYKSIN